MYDTSPKSQAADEGVTLDAMIEAASDEYEQGHDAAIGEIDADGWSPALARRYLAMTTPREGCSFDAGFRAAVLAHAERG